MAPQPMLSLHGDMGFIGGVGLILISRTHFVPTMPIGMVLCVCACMSVSIVEILRTYMIHLILFTVYNITCAIYLSHRNPSV